MLNVNPEESFKSAFVAVIGRPNVGKSTLVNRFLDQDLAVVSPKPQTTRNRISAIMNYPNAQIVFYDTPGFHESTSALNQSLVSAAKKAAIDADLILFVTMAQSAISDDDHQLFEFLRGCKKPVVVAINKIDLLTKSQKKSVTRSYENLKFVKHLEPISALTGEGMERLIEKIIVLAPAGTQFYAEDYISDLPERFFVAEFIREQIIHLTSQEIPYKSAVIIEKYVENPDRIIIHADIHVERESQKKILIGHHGSMIRNIGIGARKKIEEFLNCPVHLELYIKVTPKWTSSPSKIRDFGY